MAAASKRKILLSVKDWSSEVWMLTVGLMELCCSCTAGDEEVKLN